jgi:hypothetical protein
MIQWWYGHNAVGFFLTAAFLGMMYYFIPIQVGRPVYSYRLSIVHFWALICRLHVGRWSPSALLRPARLDPVAGHGVLADPVCSQLGRHDQRHHDPVRQLGQAAHRSDHPLHDCRPVVLWHVDLRRPDDVDQDGECPVAQHRLDRGSRPLRRSGLGGHDLHRLAVCADSRAFSTVSACTASA